MDIRNILNIISENSVLVKEESPLSGNMEVMSLDQFLEKSGVEPEEDMSEAKLGGVSARPFKGDELQGYLDRTVNKSKEKTDKYKMPYIHKSNIPVVDEKGKKYNSEALMKEISTRPPKILKQNEKMQHSDGTTSIFYNVGLPALTGLAVDEDKGEFVIINTCPGAGACKTYCYAMKGGYVQWKSVSLGQSRLLNWLYNDPEGFMAQLDSEISKAERTYGKKGTKVVIRWHDAGDFFSPEYLDRAYTLAKKHPDVDFYAYTKLAGVAQASRPSNFKMNYSMGAKGSEEQKIDFQKTKNSRVIPRELFNDLIAKDGAKLVKDSKGRMQFSSKENLETFKQRLAAKYSVKPESILTYDQMMSKPLGKDNQYNVMVMPGDGDDGANRSDILNSFLLMH